MPNFLLADLISNIKIGILKRIPEVVVWNSKFVSEILRAMVREGYIRGFSLAGASHGKVRVLLKFDLDGVSQITNVKVVSTPW